MCDGCHAEYEIERERYESAIDSLLGQRVDLFEHMLGREDRRWLASHILAHATNGAVGFSNPDRQPDLRGTFAASVDFLEERRERRAAVDDAAAASCQRVVRRSGRWSAA